MTIKFVNTNLENVLNHIFSDMQTQFPPEELRDFDYFYKSLTQKTDENSGGTYRLAVLEIENQICAYVFYYVSDFLWVDYLAVFKEFHSCGYGTELLNELFEKYTDLKGCYFEVEKADESLPQTLKRMRFYERLGCVNTGINYLFPIDNDAISMELLFKPFNSKLPSRSEHIFAVERVFNHLHSSVKGVDDTFKKMVDY